ELQGEGKPDDTGRRVTAYTYRLAKDYEGRRIVYKPGDNLHAELPLRDDWMLSWLRGRAGGDQPGHLTLNEAPLHKKSQAATSGEVVKPVVLKVTRGQPIPQVPDLVPGVNLKK